VLPTERLADAAHRVPPRPTSAILAALRDERGD
jgi:hypothetical protein